MRRVKRRDRHGRGLRGPLAPPEVPISLTRAEKFDDLVREEVQRVVAPWRERLAGVEFAVEDIPPADAAATQVPLGVTRTVGGVPRVVVFRRPLEARAGKDGKGERELVRLIHDVVVDEVAQLLGLDPDDVDEPEDE
ncbi:metallopeptidase family protein [Actinocorallia sp. A-T 12471]|uniref:metallopeptidase family protein n=1 Tax=Actinocorallia sp. A-T 12471 TaxID=3089813 RepID=UPI0029CC77B6|nr:metallopeptidase family protein [Actinocorallia sp. A-T 12471]MDX6744610.1 metallopeptidase family protein [Actinocorallia sp. A-T 12471]